MYAIALDVGGTSVKGSLVDEKGNQSHAASIGSFHWKTSAAMIKGMVDFVKTLRVQEKNIVGVGLGIPGPCDSKNGIVHVTPNLPIKRPFPLRDHLKKELRMPVFIQNDGNCAAFGEATWGAAKGARVAILLTLGTGIGSGIIIDGKIFDGAFGQAPELGHLPIDPRSKQTCGAGHHGCLESCISKEYIKKMVERRLGKRLPLLEVENMARAGNKKALALWQDVGGYLGLAIGSLLNIFNPEVVIIGGGISPAFDLFEEAIKKEAAKLSFPSMLKQMRLVKAHLGNEAGKLGAARLVFENIKH